MVTDTLKILVVDDNKDITDIFAQVLRLSIKNAEVEVAYGGQEAIEKARAFKPNFLLVDIHMPDIDGYEVVRIIKNDKNFTEAIFIAVTGYGQEDDKKLAYEFGFDYHFTKPVDMEALLPILNGNKKE